MKSFIDKVDDFQEWCFENNIVVINNYETFGKQEFEFKFVYGHKYIINDVDILSNKDRVKEHILNLIKPVKNTIDVNVKITDIEPFKDLINLLKENINSLPNELKDKLSEILEK